MELKISKKLPLIIFILALISCSLLILSYTFLNPFTSPKFDFEDALSEKKSLFDEQFIPEGYRIDNAASGIDYLKEIEGENFAEYDIEEYCLVEEDPSLFCEAFESGTGVSITNGSGAITITTYYAYDTESGALYLDDILSYVDENDIYCGGGALVSNDKTIYMNIIGNISTDLTAKEILNNIKEQTGFKLVYYCTTVS